MKLYAVELKITIIAWAPDEEQAKVVARTFEKDERRHAEVESVAHVIDSTKLPGGWEAGCIPYGREDDTTIGMIIGYPPKPPLICEECKKEVCDPGCPLKAPF